MTISSRSYIHYMFRNIIQKQNNKIKEQNNQTNTNLECIICGKSIPQNELKHNCKSRYFCNSSNSNNDPSLGNPLGNTKS
jgi:fructose-specific component phosphotransferase system IIB-like protein